MSTVTSSNGTVMASPPCLHKSSSSTDNKDNTLPRHHHQAAGVCFDSINDIFFLFLQRLMPTVRKTLWPSLDRLRMFTKHHSSFKTHHLPPPQLPQLPQHPQHPKLNPMFLWGDSVVSIPSTPSSCIRSKKRLDIFFQISNPVSSFAKQQLWCKKN